MHVEMHSITSIDNALGAGAMVAQIGKGEDKIHGSMLRDCKFYGESIVPDCPNEAKGEF